MKSVRRSSAAEAARPSYRSDSIDKDDLIRRALEHKQKQINDYVARVNAEALKKSEPAKPTIASRIGGMFSRTVAAKVVEVSEPAPLLTAPTIKLASASPGNAFVRTLGEKSDSLVVEALINYFRAQVPLLQECAPNEVDTLDEAPRYALTPSIDGAWHQLVVANTNFVTRDSDGWLPRLSELALRGLTANIAIRFQRCRFDIIDVRDVQIRSLALIDCAPNPTLESQSVVLPDETGVILLATDAIFTKDFIIRNTVLDVDGNHPNEGPLLHERAPAHFAVLLADNMRSDEIEIFGAKFRGELLTPTDPVISLKGASFGTATFECDVLGSLDCSQSKVTSSFTIQDGRYATKSHALPTIKIEQAAIGRLAFDFSRPSISGHVTFRNTFCDVFNLTAITLTHDKALNAGQNYSYSLRGLTYDKLQHVPQKPTSEYIAARKRGVPKNVEASRYQRAVGLLPKAVLRLIQKRRSIGGAPTRWGLPLYLDWLAASAEHPQFDVSLLPESEWNVADASQVKSAWNVSLQPWTQCAAALRRIGEREQAEHVLFEREKVNHLREFGSLGATARFWCVLAGGIVALHQFSLESEDALFASVALVFLLALDKVVADATASPSVFKGFARELLWITSGFGYEKIRAVACMAIVVVVGGCIFHFADQNELLVTARSAELQMYVPSNVAEKVPANLGRATENLALQEFPSPRAHSSSSLALGSSSDCCGCNDDGCQEGSGTYYAPNSPMPYPGAPGPRGPRGSKGEKGDKGAAGEQGQSGDKGPQGNKGALGEKGAPGDRGPTGEIGPKGKPGDRGAPGPTGSVQVLGEASVKESAKAVGYPPFNALMYSVDIFVPMINFGQGDYWVPGTPHKRHLGEKSKADNAFPDWKGTELILRWLWIWYWLQVGLGWLLTTILLASLSGFLEKKE